MWLSYGYIPKPTIVEFEKFCTTKHGGSCLYPATSSIQKPKARALWIQGQPWGIW